MINAIGAMGANHKTDSEYIRILMELNRLGIKPTGNKQVDKARLEEEKQKLAQKINEKIENQEKQNPEIADKTKIEEQKLGAMTLADLNKIWHGLR